MKNLLLLIVSAGLLSACGTSFCRQNMCNSCTVAAAPAPAPKAEEPKKEPVKKEPVKPVPQIDTTKKFTMGATAFKYNAFDFTEEAEKSLNDLAEFMAANPNTKITVSGHTDNRGKLQYNQTLSEKRAKAVKTYLEGKGISGTRVKTVGYGPSKPIAPNTTPAGRAKNRRVEIIFDK